MIASVQLTVSLILMILALLFVILAALGKAPLWAAVLCIVLEGLIRCVPLSS